ncbi:hypothetical protein SPHINGOT1_120009 [Sphingomonas sp. T1]|nr:hypothetical protein SPHINGOT1_120009 [Sphingomonas sp. T1]
MDREECAGGSRAQLSASAAGTTEPAHRARLRRGRRAGVGIARRSPQHPLPHSGEGRGLVGKAGVTKRRLPLSPSPNWAPAFAGVVAFWGECSSPPPLPFLPYSRSPLLSFLKPTSPSPSPRSPAKAGVQGLGQYPWFSWAPASAGEQQRACLPQAPHRPKSETQRWHNVI